MDRRTTTNNQHDRMGDPRDSRGGRSRADGSGDRSGAPRKEVEVSLSDGLEPIACPEKVMGMFGEYGISFEPGEIEKLGLYLAHLMAMNTRMNLTAIRDEESAWERHLFDALTLVPVLREMGESGKIVDIGSGGGIPGIPLAIVMPTFEFTLVDATKKKTAFLSLVVEKLGLKNVSVINSRAEGLGQDKGTKVLQGYTGGHREQYDAAMARAVGKVAMIAELTVPLVKIGGLVVLTKGEKADEEVAEAKKALHMLHTHHIGTVETPTGRVVVLEKQRATPKMYPRKDGEPKRMPLGIVNK
ncbi:MAG: 16S rRNA (guanine(527)-N(7))-methyltransferase RsmG [Phycisphaerales bacterium]|nr:16S rRNA (guanine(527)-N(7))-methyltransferase RsmG [Phycisphaerales bacterium]